MNPAALYVGAAVLAGCGLVGACYLVATAINALAAGLDAEEHLPPEWVNNGRSSREAK